MGEIGLVSNILPNIFLCVQQNKINIYRSGTIEGEPMMTEISL